MPTLISREEALARIVAEGARPPCLMCAILEGRVGALHVVHEDPELVLMLPRYVRSWGHALIVPRAHVTTFGGITDALWGRIYGMAHRAAKMVEEVHRPRRVYVTSTGSSTVELVQSSRHVHVHVIPVHTEEDRPAAIFSWQEGVYVGDDDEWRELRARYAAWWNAAP